MPFQKSRTPSAQVEAGDPLETLPIEDAAAQEDPSSIGTGYGLCELLGHGGIGQVHAARQRSLGRMVAVKTLRRDADSTIATADRAEIRRFRAEAVATALLEHPNIVPVHDLAAAADGTLMLAMKHIDGATWRVLLHPHSGPERERAGALTLEDHLEILLKVCDGMAFAHARGLVHADLKPDNIMIGDYGEVLITDWGCAVAVGKGLPALIPRPGALRSMRGTPAYMAPEVAAGHVRRISPRTDVFQLGAILYEILTGTPPYRGCRLEEVLAEAALARIEPPERRAPQRELSEELSTLAMDALSLDPAQRPHSVRMFAARLADYRRHAAANALADAARDQLELARVAGDGGEEHYRRAIAFCERGIDIWPERPVSRHQLAEAQIEYAEFALGTQAFHLAHAQAVSAADHARSSGRLDLLRRAEDTAAKAERASTRARRRERHFAMLRLGLTAAVLALACALLAGLLINQERSRQLERSEQLAELAASHARSEHAAELGRIALLGGLAPRFLGEARQAAADGRWQEAAEDAGVALASSPRLHEAWLLRTVALALLGRTPEAAEAVGQWRSLDPQDADAGHAAGLVARLREHADAAASAALRGMLPASWTTVMPAVHQQHHG